MKIDTIVAKLMCVKCETLLPYTVLYICSVGHVLLHYKCIHTSFWQASQASGASVASSGKSQKCIIKEKRMFRLKEQAFPSTESNTEQRFQTNAYTVLEAGFVL